MAFLKMGILLGSLALSSCGTKAMLTIVNRSGAALDLTVRPSGNQPAETFSLAVGESRTLTVDPVTPGTFPERTISGSGAWKLPFTNTYRLTPVDSLRTTGDTLTIGPDIVRFQVTVQAEVSTQPIAWVDISTNTNAPWVSFMAPASPFTTNFTLTNRGLLTVRGAMFTNSHRLSISIGVYQTNYLSGTHAGEARLSYTQDIQYAYESAD